MSHCISHSCHIHFPNVFYSSKRLCGVHDIMFKERLLYMGYLKKSLFTAFSTYALLQNRSLAETGAEKSCISPSDGKTISAKRVRGASFTAPLSHKWELY
jgi:hypothetical protein